MPGLRILLFFVQAVSIVVTSEQVLVGPNITLDKGVFTGIDSGLTHKFLGIPFAKPPVDDLRFTLPQTISAYEGEYDATRYGPACPQPDMSFDPSPGTNSTADTLTEFVTPLSPDSEDCLTINIIKPAFHSKLPVVVWIYGGAFEIGGSSIYDGTVIVSHSIDMGSPVIYVSINYRLGGFGFLGGKEVKDARVGNLGLHDQREALRWVQRYISQFGGDPSKVTIFGESAGAMSISLQMLAFNGSTDLFRAGFMMSGGPNSVGDITDGQPYYDALVDDRNCTNANDTLSCLRTIPYEELKAAMNKPALMALYQLGPQIDGILFTDNPPKLVQQNKIANVPYITGNCDDEGTIFALLSNVTTDAEFKEWIQAAFIPRLSNETVDKIMQLYPADVTKGSPYDTGSLNALTPQFKRMASFAGDVIFQAPRRWMLENTVATNPNVWTYLSKRLKSTPFLGSFHGSDIIDMYGGGELCEYFINFATNLDPNSASVPVLKWPKYDLNSRNMLTPLDSVFNTTQDNYRKEAIEYLMHSQSNLRFDFRSIYNH